MDRRVISGILGLLIGIAVAALLAPAIFQMVHTDLSRIGVLLKAAHDAESVPRVVVLGNSVIMDGVDARLVSKGLPEAPLAHNYASTGQSLIESYLYYQELLPGVKWLVQTLTPAELARAPRFQEQRYNAYYMYGYRPNAGTVDRLESIFGSSMVEILSTSDLAQRFRSRWAVRQLVDNGMRRLLRSDLALEASTFDLFHPSIRAQPLPQVGLERALRRWFDAWPARSFQANPQSFELMSSMLHWRSSGGRELVFLLPPIHPWIRAQRGEAFYRAFRSSVKSFAERHAVPVIDTIDLLSAHDFGDHQHPTQAGAVLLSEFLGDRLGEVDAAGRELR